MSEREPMSHEAQLLVLLTEVAGDVKVVKTEVLQNRREIEQVRDSHLRLEERITALERARYKLMGGAAAIGALASAGGSTLLQFATKGMAP